ncbi:MAG: 16S rRNA (guanine(527)-N(7))-methyltransferase RsmG [Vulcanimicrobiota bacterium]
MKTTNFKNSLIKKSEEFKISLKEEQFVQLELYFKMLVQYGKRINLKGKLNYEEIIDFLFIDSMVGAKYLELPVNCRVIDIGTGAGFPGIPLKIMYPSVKVTLLDSSYKKINFVKEVCREIALTDMKFVCERAEIAGKKIEYREQYNCVTSKALAGLPVLLELASPFVRPEGKVVCWKGINYNEELKLMGEGYKRLSLNTPGVIKYNISPDSETNLLIFLKMDTLEKRYPRSYQAIKREPIK